VSHSGKYSSSGTPPNTELTEYEERALQMLNGDLPMLPGAMVNQCVEHLRYCGYITRSGVVTDAGKAKLEAINGRKHSAQEGS